MVTDYSGVYGSAEATSAEIGRDGDNSWLDDSQDNISASNNMRDSGPNGLTSKKGKAASKNSV